MLNAFCTSVTFVIGLNSVINNKYSLLCNQLNIIVAPTGRLILW